ncbi:MAG TPA: type II toxin-antitoxin system VapC family toxin [Gemmataceae bacterium]|nr:type II toxin-antitoxin system VapC family toxin [Gemmataceae bacterium]
MTALVVDSSVAIKWYVPEALAAEALQVRDGAAPLHAPDFLEVEVAAIVWKKIRRGAMTRLVGDGILADLPALGIITYHATRPLVTPAFDLADRTGRTVYDCPYLALAAQLGGVMVTADEKLVNSLAGTPWAASILRLPDVP